MADDLTPKSQSNDTNHSRPSQATSSPKKGPSTTPTKASKNKRKNDAKRRNANLKKQQNQPTPPQSPIKADQENCSNPQEPKDKIIMDKSIEGKSGHVQNQPDPSPPLEPSPTKTIESNRPDQENTGSLKDATTNNGNNKPTHDTNSWRRRQREYKELRDQIKMKNNQLQTLADRLKLQINKIKELETSLVSASRTSSQFEKLLQEELINRSRLESENEVLNQTISRLRNQVAVHEKNKSTNDELIRVLNATLMERETEVSILKLKMTRIQAKTPSTKHLNSASSMASVKNDPCRTYATEGRSNSEFCRNSYVRASMMADVSSVRSSATHLQNMNDRDALVWANVPEELTPSKRPLILERLDMKDFQPAINSSTPILTRDRRYKTLPKSMKSPSQEFTDLKIVEKIGEKGSPQLQPVSQSKQHSYCLVTNLDDSNRSSGTSGNRTSENYTSPDTSADIENSRKLEYDNSGLELDDSAKNTTREPTADGQTSLDAHYSTIEPDASSDSHHQHSENAGLSNDNQPPSLPVRTPTTPVKLAGGLKKIFGKFRRSDSSTGAQNKSDNKSDVPVTPNAGAFQRGNNRATLVGPPSNIRAQLSHSKRSEDFHTDKPFAEWDTDMIVDWLNMIGLSMYTGQCRRWVKCGAHIMNATLPEVDKGLGITNPLHRKKLRLAITELNGNSDKVTKAASKLDYLWVARWLDDIGLPQYKDSFINGRVDGRVLNYLTIEDLVSLGVKSLLHHSSIKCGIKVLRSINFDLQLLKRRATADEIEQMSSVRERIDQDEQESNAKSSEQSTLMDNSDVPLWTCHRVMEWLRMIDFSEFAPNLRGSGIHGGLIVHEDAFNLDTLCTLLSIPASRTLLRRHLATFFDILIGKNLVQRKKQHVESAPNQSLNPLTEIKTPKKSTLWFTKLKSSRVGQDGMDDYLCPMYPIEPPIMRLDSPRKTANIRENSNLPRIPESINV